MSIKDMIYWLNRAQFIPHGYGESINAVGNNSTAKGTVPTIAKGAANSVQAIYNTSNAIGSVVESV